MRKVFKLMILGIISSVFSLNSAMALTTYNYDSWKAGSGYGSISKIDDNITNLKGENVPSGGMFVGPYSKSSSARLDDETGIVEEVYVEIDPDKIVDGEYFEVSLALKNGVGDYVNEAVVMTQRTGDDFSVTAGWATSFSPKITEKGIYTYQWKVYTEESTTFVVFNLLKDDRQIATTGSINFDNVTTADTKTPISNEEEVSVKYLWFCNINVQNGINVYAELPKVKVTLIDLTDEDESIEYEVIKGYYYTEEELNKFIDSLKKSAEEEGYTFDGFFADKDCKSEFNMLEPFDDDVVIYVKGTKIEKTLKLLTMFQIM